jgi:uncharacterized protein (DUF697 family)
MNAKLSDWTNHAREWVRTALHHPHDGAPGSEFAEPSSTPGIGSLWQGTGVWDDLAMEIGQESQARVAFIGRPNAGKSLLFNRLRGWVISRPCSDGATVLPCVESYGMFVLADLPDTLDAAAVDHHEFTLSLGDPALTVYLLDGPAGVGEADFRHVALLRAAGKPVVVALNKSDLIEDRAAAVAEAQRRLGMTVLPISAQTGEGVEDALLPAMLDAAPRLAVPLGREIQGLRRAASRRVIRQAALLAGLLSAQPVPLLDLPFQAMIQAGVVMRVGAAYGRTPSGGLNREVIGAVVGTLAVRYLAQTALKFVPLLGWALSGLIGAAATLLIGESAIRYYEAGGTGPLLRGLSNRAPRPRHKRRSDVTIEGGPTDA